jgi:hypothetical protein
MRRTYMIMLLLALVVASTGAVLAAEEEILSLGTYYTVTILEPVASYQEIETRDYPDVSLTKLTDGKFAEEVDFKNPAFVGYLRQKGREIVIDLGAEADISEVIVRVLADPDVGIHFPASAAVSFSDDGQLWSEPVSKNIAESLFSEILPVSFKTASSGRYVKVFLPVNIWVFTDEIIVKGSFAE